jgi:hypothetical protein
VTIGRLVIFSAAAHGDPRSKGFSHIGEAHRWSAKRHRISRKSF